MSKNISLDALREHLFETLEGVKNLSDAEASECERTSIEQAKAICDISGKILDTYKVQIAGISLANNIAKEGSMNNPMQAIESMGIANREQVQLLEGRE